MLAHALVLLALAAPADSSRWTIGPDVTERALAALHAQGRVAAVRWTRLRPRDSGFENTVAVDTLWADASWLLRFERLAQEMPLARVRVPRLFPGQSYPFVFRVAAPESPGAPDAWVDFRGPAVILRFGPDSTTRSMRGREGEMAALLRQLDPRDPALRLLAETCGLKDVLPTAEAAAAPAGAAEPAAAAESLADSAMAAPVDPSIPVVLKRVEPVYPPKARRDGVQGTVVIKVLVDEKGQPAEVRVVKSVAGLDNAAVAAVARWTFTPAKKDGQPIAAWVMVPVKFELK